MIPASYLFKDVFQKEFYDADILEATERHRRSRHGGGIVAWLKRWRPEGTSRPTAAPSRQRPALQA